MENKIYINRKWQVIFVVFFSVFLNVTKAAPTLDTVISFAPTPITGSAIVYVKLKPLNTDFTGNIDCLLSLSSDTLSAYQEFACGIRFKNVNDRAYNTFIDAYDAHGQGYTLTTMEFLLDMPVHFWIDVNVTGKSYSVHATQDSLTAPEMIATDFGFRNAATTQISCMGIHSNDQQPNVLNSIAVLNRGFVGAVGSYTLAPGVPINNKSGKNADHNIIFSNSVIAGSKIFYRIIEPSAVLFSIYDLYGNKIISLSDNQKLPGQYFFNINRKELQPGIFFFKFDTEQNSTFGKIHIN